MNWRKHEDKSNPIIPYEIVKYLHATLKEFTASEEGPAVLARAKPMNPAGGADEGRARKPPKKGRRPVQSLRLMGKLRKPMLSKIYICVTNNW